MGSIRGSATKSEVSFEDGGKLMTKEESLESKSGERELKQNVAGHVSEITTREDAAKTSVDSPSMQGDGTAILPVPKESHNNQMNSQLTVLKRSFRFFHPWQPSSMEGLEEEYHHHEDILHENDRVKGNNVLVVKDLPPNLDDGGLRDWFSPFGLVTQTTSSRNGIGTVTFEDGSDGAERAMEARPVKIFGQVVEIRLKEQQRRGGRDRPSPPRSRAGPFPIVVAPPNFGPLVSPPAAKSNKRNAKTNAPAASPENQDKSSQQKCNNKESKGGNIFDMATQTFTSAATKLIAQSSDNNQLFRSSAPPMLNQMPQKKASLQSLLSSGPTEGDPLFDDDEHYAVGDDEPSAPTIVLNYNGEHDGILKESMQESIGRRERMRCFHSDDTLTSWIWSTGGQKHSSPYSCSQAESDLRQALVRGRAVNAKLPLLSTMSSQIKQVKQVHDMDIERQSSGPEDTDLKLSEKIDDKDKKKKELGLEDTNLNLLYKTMDVTVKRAAPGSSRSRHVCDDEVNEAGNNGAAAYKLYQARHPSLAPLISVAKCTAIDNNTTSTSVVSVFDVTPLLHRSLHELLRTEDFLTRPLFPGVEGHELEPLADDLLSAEMDDRSKAEASPLNWFRSADRDDGFCSCHKSSSECSNDGLGGDQQQMHHDSIMTRSSSEPNLLPNNGAGESAKVSPPPIDFFGDLRKLREGGAAILAGAGLAAADGHVPQPPPNFMRRRRPWKMFRVGLAHRADVADLRICFLALQLFHAVNFCHSKGMTLGEQLSPDRIFVQEDGWVRLVLPIAQWKPERDVLARTENKEGLSKPIMKANANALTSAAEEDPSPKRQWRSIFRINNDGSPNFDKAMDARGDRGGVAILPYPGYGDVPTVQWQRGQLTNLCYLMMLNAAAGRAVGDPANPPILPWVTDFSSRIDRAVTDSGKFCTADNCWRDLSKSKFRLKKGDEQLDQTFAHASPPHHIPESICELTYAVYRARCLPIDHLRSIVRKDFVSAHYPGSVRALYDWTPDEATIEFYVPTDPCIFRSKHSEMDDLALPSWCGLEPESFIFYHRRLLESDHVSHRLHSWIDLNFGEALAGKRAIVEKNVVLSALPWANGGCRDRCEGSCRRSVFLGAPADERHWITSSMRKCRFVQLFSGPHPKKHSDLRKTVSSALRTAFHQNDKEAAEAIGNSECVPPPQNDDAADFRARKQRDISAIGAILRDCYISARVIPAPAVDTAIEELLKGVLDLRQSLKDLAGDRRQGSKSFPFPGRLKGAYQVLSNVQNLTFQRWSSDAGFVDGNGSTFRSTALEKVWRLIQGTQTQCLESLTGSCVGLILQAILSPLKSTTPFIENCTGAYYSSFTDRFLKYLISLSKIILSADLILPSFLKFLSDASDYASNNSQNCLVVAEELGKIFLSCSLINSLYSSSTGELFISRVISFATKQLCAHSTISEPDSLQLKSMSILFISMLAQEETLGVSICCKFIIPSLIYSIENSSTINGRNAIVQALKSLMPFLQEDSIGVLICKPILRDVIPGQLATCHKPCQFTDSSTVKAFRLLKDLTVLLQHSLRHLDPKAIGNYFLHSNSGSILQLLSVSFEAVSSSPSESDKKVMDCDCTSRCGDLCKDPYQELLKEARVLVREVVCRIDTCRYVFSIVELLCSQVNDSYLSIALNQSAGQQNNSVKDKVMSLPGIEDALVISNRARKVCEREELELHCPSAIEFLAWLNPARGIQIKPNVVTTASAIQDFDKDENLPKKTPYNDNLHDIIGGDGLSLEMRAPKRQTDLSVLSTEDEDEDDLESIKNDHVKRDESSGTSSSGLAMNDMQQNIQTSYHQDGQSESKRDLVWLLGLNKEEREDSIRYAWQPRMMLARKLNCSRALKSGNKVDAAITSMVANQAESMLVAGTSQGELLLFDLRRHPPALKQKNQLGGDDGIREKIPTIRQVEFFDEHNILVCDGGLHLFSTVTQKTISSLSLKNAFCHDSNEMRGRSWRGDNFVGFSIFPKLTGLSEILDDSSCEFAAISPSHVYSVDVRCHNSISSRQSLLWHGKKKTKTKIPKFDQMFGALTWNTASLQREETLVNSHNSLRVGSSFELTCVTTHQNWICTGSDSGHIHCFDRRRGKLLHCWKGHTKSIEYLEAISRHRLLSAGGDKTAVLWDLTKTPPRKISTCYNIPGKEHAMNLTCFVRRNDGLVSLPGDSNLVLCAASGRKAVFMPMSQEPQPDNQHPMGVRAERIVMSDFEGNRIPSSGKLNISSIALLPCRQLVLLGCDGEIHVCL